MCTALKLHRTCPRCVMWRKHQGGGDGWRRMSSCLDVPGVLWRTVFVLISVRKRVFLFVASLSWGVKRPPDGRTGHAGTRSCDDRLRTTWHEAMMSDTPNAPVLSQITTLPCRNRQTETRHTMNVRETFVFGRLG